MRPGRSQIANVLVFVVLTVLGCVSSCSNETSVSPTVAGDGSVIIDPGAGGNIFLGPATLHNAPGFRVDVWGEGLTIESETVVSFNLVIVNKSDGTFYPPATFEIIAIEPEGVEVLNADANGAASSTFYIGDDFGDDYALHPGERSSPVRIEFEVPGLTSFSFGFNVGAYALGSESISGTVFSDVNRNGRFDPTMELGLAGERVWLYTTPTDDNPTGIVDNTDTDARGAYAFWDLPAGVYSVRVSATEGLIPTTPNPLLVSLVEGADGEVVPLAGVDFGFFDTDPPESMWLVELEVPAGTEQEAVFVNPASPSNHRYVLHLVEPVYFRAPVGALYGGRVWINDTLAYEFECDELYSEWNCLEGIFRRIDLPPELVEFGENHIRVAVDGWGEPFLLFAIERLPQD
jgi:hypothetical protein